MNTNFQQNLYAILNWIFENKLPIVEICTEYAYYATDGGTEITISNGSKEVLIFSSNNLWRVLFNEEVPIFIDWSDNAKQQIIDFFAPPKETLPLDINKYLKGTKDISEFFGKMPEDETEQAATPTKYYLDDVECTYEQCVNAKVIRTVIDEIADGDKQIKLISVKCWTTKAAPPIKEQSAPSPFVEYPNAAERIREVKQRRHNVIARAQEKALQQISKEDVSEDTLKALFAVVSEECWVCDEKPCLCTGKK